MFALAFAAEKLGISSFKPEQTRAIWAFASGHDVFVSLPTGYGKSACYGSLPMVFDKAQNLAAGSSIAIVISPLKALMKDQLASFSSKGVKAVQIGGTRMNEDMKKRVLEGRYQPVFLSPEELLRNLTWREMLHLPVYQQNIVGLVVDESRIGKCLS